MCPSSPLHNVLHLPLLLFPFLIFTFPSFLFSSLQFNFYFFLCIFVDVTQAVQKVTTELNRSIASGIFDTMMKSTGAMRIFSSFPSFYFSIILAHLFSLSLSFFLIFSFTRFLIRFSLAFPRSLHLFYSQQELRTFRAPSPCNLSSLKW